MGRDEPGRTLVGATPDAGAEQLPTHEPASANGRVRPQPSDEPVERGRTPSSAPAIEPPHAARPATLTTHLRRANAALERQQHRLAAAQEAIAELVGWRDQCLREADESVAADRTAALRAQADSLTRQISVLERQLEVLEYARATAGSQAMGLRQVSENAADGLPFRAGPMSGAGLDGLENLGGPASRHGPGSTRKPDDPVGK